MPEFKYALVLSTDAAVEADTREEADDLVERLKEEPLELGVDWRGMIKIPIGYVVGEAEFQQPEVNS
ncbi:hypothetical protein [Kitasatospora sp. NPDC098663]|uniref:hypothetical protein n=1 Tax=Kitasatospora sp. NPDC098663 TaxID=3364096 RepID=UPI003828C853